VRRRSRVERYGSIAPAVVLSAASSASARHATMVTTSQSKRSEYPANTPPDATLYDDVELVEILSQ
jgi:hypothetical protein